MSQRHYYLWLFSLLPALFGSHPIHAQSLALESFNVDSVAVPRGGYAILETFLTANVQKPFMAQVANVKGRVFVSAVVEPNGHLSDLKVIRGLRPDCDREALRVMGLFAGWKPALKEGKTVRQIISYPVTFRANDPVDYVAGQRIEYFDAAQKPTSSSQSAAYQQTAAVDTTSGLPNGPLVVYSVQNGKLRETVRLPFVRSLNKPAVPTKMATYRIGHKQADGSWFSWIYTIDQLGNVLIRYNSSTFEEVAYDENGLVRSSKNFDGARSVMRWHGNGLLQAIEAYAKPTPDWQNPPSQIISLWDSTGQQLVTKGNGMARLYSTVSSRSNADKRVLFTEMGAYVNGFKDGKWTGAYADNSYQYNEAFAQGKPLGGSAFVNGQQKITYTADEQSPEFRGGKQGLYTFLGQTMRYPADAQRAGAQGKVFVSFTVCTDGSLCDYELLKGAHPALNEEALRVVRESNGQWQPGLQRGEPVRVKYNLPVSFTIN